MKKFLEYVKECFGDLKNSKTAYKQIPNMLTLSRLLGIIPVNILFFTGNVVPAFVILGLLLTTDFFDGKLARKFNATSKFGADLDAVCDKAMTFGLAIPLIVSNPMILLNLLFEAMISIVNIMTRKSGTDVKTNKFGKVKTWLLFITLGLGYLAQFASVSSIVLNSCIASTLIAQIITYGKYVDEYKKAIGVEIPIGIQYESSLVKKEDDSVDKELSLNNNYHISKSKNNKLVRVRKK